MRGRHTWEHEHMATTASIEQGFSGPVSRLEAAIPMAAAPGAATPTATCSS